MNSEGYWGLVDFTDIVLAKAIRPEGMHGKNKSW